MTSHVASAARTFVLLQLGVRLVTFALNQVLVRTTAPAVYGAANVQLELVLSVVLYTARDSVRSVALRRPSHAHDLVLAMVPVGALFAAATSWAYLHTLVPDELAAYGPALAVSVALYYIGAVLELVAEPSLLCLVGQDAYVSVRVGMEAAAVLGRACATAALLMPPGLDALARALVTCGIDAPPAAVSLAAYGVGRAVYGAAMLCAALFGAMRATGLRRAAAAYVPRWAIDGETRQLALYTLLQSLTKQTLAEGDKIAVARLAPLKEQGGYALASNYGSLAARILFQPVEESARLFFASAPKAAESVRLVHSLLRAHVVFALALVAFGPPLSQPGLVVLAGERWAFDGAAPSAASRILACYCWYLPVMGVNGIVEAYMQSRAPPRALARYSYVLLASSVVFVASLWTVRGAGVTAEAALIAASALSLGVRAAASWRWMYAHLGASDARAASRVSVRSVVPAAAVMAAFALAAGGLRAVSEPLVPGDVRALVARAVDAGSAVSRMAAACVGGLLLVGTAVCLYGI